MLSSRSGMGAPERIHPSLWLASQLARGGARGVPTGFDALDAELPERGWPNGMLIELLLPYSGIGELRLLRPVLADRPEAGQHGRIALLQPPHPVNAPGWMHLGVTPQRLLQLQAQQRDALWAAEQVLRAGCCHALLMWQPRLRGEALRRLQLAAQSSATLFFMMRPMSCAAESSPAPLRLALHPARDGLEIGFIKRRGPRRDKRLFIPLSPSPNLQRHVPVDRRSPAIATARSLSPELGR
ncbi:translesion DNA synthesis-associated protein ImuA [Herbaspirillum sp. YR522]|uniref:translesion DNA synthesis-associated protein ImuA n=1 Tax=Herbaspirillum sp. YR522 TaxID=1144342 RepID=UPI0002D76FB8|nr:translesion DNA synthesis-associated protein ImuA [Herbaspirillum sp. YR522]